MVFRDRDLKLQLRKLQRIADIWDNDDYNKSVSRAQKMTTHSMLDWVDTHITDIGKAAEDYRKQGDKISLLELRKAVSILQALTEELLIREDVLH